MPKFYAKIWGMRTGILYEYRRAPVPFTACRGGTRYAKRYLKQPSSTPERRAYFHDEISEYNIRIRGRRKSTALPNAWDDGLRSDIGIRNWKRHRQTQYKS